MSNKLCGDFYFINYLRLSHEIKNGNSEMLVFLSVNIYKTGGLMYSVLLAVIYAAFISLGLPDSLLGAAWPAMQSEMAAPVSAVGIYQ